LFSGQPQEILICVGSPGSGKSTFVLKYLSEYSRVNNDELKTKEKCLKVCEEQLKLGKSVVIDNTNPSADVRQRYTSIAKSLNIPVRALYFDVDKQTCFHNNFMRKANAHRKHISKAVPGIPIHGFFKNHTVPLVSEGFASVIRINFVADDFQSSADEEAYKSLSL
jgi:bifunctional polynucleotide phosphatase/kinase